MANNTRKQSLYLAFKEFIDHVVSAGTSSYPADAARRLRILNVMSYLAAISTFMYIIQYMMLDMVTYKPIIIINIIIFLLLVLIPFVHHYHELAGSFLLMFTEFAALFALTSYLGHHSGIQIQYIVGASVPFLILGLHRIRLILFIIFVSFILHLLSWFAYPRDQAVIMLDDATLRIVYINAAATTFIVTAAVIYYAVRLADRAENELENLLHNILPAQIVERLKEDPNSEIADNHEDASVLFADIVGFTTLSKELGISRTTRLLNQIISKFDMIAAELGIEKIKTIGDAYMAVSGVPTFQTDHGKRLGLFALRARQAVHMISEQEKLDLKVRIGLASGPLMAGLIGQNKFAYDVWGDTVNLASRMETQGNPNRIQVNADFKEKTQNDFHFIAGGIINIRGMGDTQTWFLEREI